MKYAALLFLAAVGCTRCPSVGPVEFTPAGYPVVLPASYQLPDMNRNKVMWLVDYRVSEWVQKKADWSLSQYQDEDLRNYARSVPIIVVDAEYVIGADGKVRSGWNQYGCYIKVPIYQGSGGYNMASLPHELTHTVLLDFHK